MAAALHEVPSRIRTVRDMIRAFADERRRQALLERPTGMTPGGEIRERVIRSGDDIAVGRLMEETVAPLAHLLSDEAKTFAALGEGFAAHDSVCRSRRKYVRCTVHANSAEGFADRPRRTRQGGIAVKSTVGAFVHP